MEAWGWIIVYLVGFTLFQLLLFRYFSDDRTFGRASLGSSDVSSPQAVERAQHAGNEEREARADEDRDGVFCRHCGAYNESDSMFTYCRNCASQLQ